MIILLGFLLIFAPTLHAATDDLRLEGVMMDTGNSANSIAVLNGSFVKQGDKVEGYLVKSVQPNAVWLVEEKTGAEKRIEVKGKPAEAEVQEPGTSESETAGEERAKSKNFGAQVNELWAAWNPDALHKKAYETKAKLDLATIYNAAVAYYNEKDVLARDMNELIRANLLAENYADPVQWEYQFYLQRAGEPFGVYADPVKKGSDIRHFYIGQDATLRVEVGKKAGAKSKPAS